MIQLLVADDHHIVRSGLKQLFALTPDIEVTAEAENSAQVKEHLRQATFDLLLLDLTMPGINGTDLVTRIHAQYPSQRILVLSMHNEPQVAARVLRAGALGYITKDSSPDKIINAVRLVANGSNYLDAALAEELAFNAINPERSKPHTKLSDREYEIFIKLAKGMSVNEIAAELSISNKTVSTHKQRMMEKMQFESLSELVRYAMNLDIFQ
jgi:DNA-binding NarL/FixJ family response regulator